MRRGSGRIEGEGFKVSVDLDLDGTGKADLSSGSAFLDHMLNSMAKTGRLDIELRLEGRCLFWAGDVGRALGLALDNCLKDRSGIRRYGHAEVPMDEALADVALDFSGRPYLVMKGAFGGDRIADLDTGQIEELLEGLVDRARMTLNLRFDGGNDHHQAESIFKALGLALREAVARDEGGIPSTKGTL